jgi:hypothetical protein
MPYYVIATRKPNKTSYTVSELIGYQVCPSEVRDGKTYILTNKAKYYLKSDFFASTDFNFNNDTFKTWNSKISAPITIEESSTGELFLKSKPNNTTTDNLQELPDC